MKRIAVGMDGSVASRTALVWATGLAEGTASEILAINGWQPGSSEVSRTAYDRLVEERQADLEGAWSEPAVGRGLTVSCFVGRGDARQIVLATAEAESADLIVLGRTGSGSGPGFLHAGSVAEHAAHHTSIPLAVIPGDAPEGIGRIVLGIDGSADSLSALAWVTEVAPALGSTVVAVQVEEPFLEWTPERSPHNWRRSVERQLDEWTAPLLEKDVPIEVVAQRDLRPVDGLLGAAAARRGDLLVIGLRGIGGFTGLRAGGVALSALHRAQLPLVLVPPARA